MEEAACRSGLESAGAVKERAGEYTHGDAAPAASPAINEEGKKTYESNRDRQKNRRLSYNRSKVRKP